MKNEEIIKYEIPSLEKGMVMDDSVVRLVADNYYGAT